MASHLHLEAMKPDDKCHFKGILDMLYLILFILPNYEGGSRRKGCFQLIWDGSVFRLEMLTLRLISVFLFWVKKNVSELVSWKYLPISMCVILNENWASFLCRIRGIEDLVKDAFHFNTGMLGLDETIQIFNVVIFFRFSSSLMVLLLLL